jgi:hypothetical protein
VCTQFEGYHFRGLPQNAHSLIIRVSKRDLLGFPGICTDFLEVGTIQLRFLLLHMCAELEKLIWDCLIRLPQHVHELTSSGPVSLGEKKYAKGLSSLLYTVDTAWSSPKLELTSRN